MQKSKNTDEYALPCDKLFDPNDLPPNVAQIIPSNYEIDHKIQNILSHIEQNVDHPFENYNVLALPRNNSFDPKRSNVAQIIPPDYEIDKLNSLFSFLNQNDEMPEIQHQ